MNCSIKYTTTFAKSLKKLSKRYKSLRKDYAMLIASLKENPLQGVDLGKNCRKVRMAIASKGKGKSGGARIITFKAIQTDTGIQLVLLDIYDKSEIDNVSDAYIEQLISDYGPQS